MAWNWSDHPRSPIFCLIQLAILAGAASLCAILARAYTSDPNIEVSRTFNTTQVAEGDTIDVIFEVVNDGSESIEGFFISEQIPNSLIVIARSVRIGTTPIKDHTYEVDEPDSVYSGATATRFVLETPSLFPEDNPIPPGETATIAYTILCPDPGTYTFENYSWAGRWDVDPDTFEVFGYDENSPSITVTGPSDISLTLVPDEIVVSRGSKLGFTITVTNNTDTTLSVEGWNDVYLANGKPYEKNPVFGPKSVPLGPHKERVKHLNQPIPANAPLGIYAYCSRVGQYGESVIDADGFLFLVVEDESAWMAHLHLDSHCQASPALASQ